MRKKSKSKENSLEADNHGFVHMILANISENHKTWIVSGMEYSIIQIIQISMRRTDHYDGHFFTEQIHFY